MSESVSDFTLPKLTVIIKKTEPVTRVLFFFYVSKRTMPHQRRPVPHSTRLYLEHLRHFFRSMGLHGCHKFFLRRTLPGATTGTLLQHYGCFFTHRISPLSNQTCPTLMDKPIITHFSCIYNNKMQFNTLSCPF